MHTHDNDWASAEKQHSSASRRDEGMEAMASMALAAGRTDALPPAAVLHLQRAAGNASVSSLLGAEHEDEPSPVKDVVGSGGGQPLDTPTRHFMEGRFGSNFGDVRVHTDSKASESAKAVSAQAYTVGSDIVFQSGTYAPETDAGKHMLAHELTHVVQQRSGPVDGTPAPGGIKISHPSDSFEQDAERHAGTIMSQPPPPAEAPLQAPQAGPVQRTEEDASPVQRAEGEEELQGSFLQRQEGEEEKDQELVQGSFLQRQEEPEKEDEAAS